MPIPTTDEMVAQLQALEAGGDGATESPAQAPATPAAALTDPTAETPEEPAPDESAEPAADDATDAEQPAADETPDETPEQPEDEGGEEAAAEESGETDEQELSKSAKRRAAQKAKLAAAEALAADFEKRTVESEAKLEKAVTLATQAYDRIDALEAENARMREALAAAGHTEAPEAARLREVERQQLDERSRAEVAQAVEKHRQASQAEVAKVRALSKLKAELVVAAADAGLDGSDDDVKAIAATLKNPGWFGFKERPTYEEAAAAVARARGVAPPVEAVKAKKAKAAASAAAKAQLEANKSGAAPPRGTAPPAAPADPKTTKGMLSLLEQYQG